MTARSIRWAFAVLLTAVLCACSSTPDQHEFLKQTYDRTAQYHGPDRNPVIVIPGILGSRLVDDETGRVVWGAFTRPYANPNSPEELRLIALPIAPESIVAPNRVRPDGVLESLELNFAGIPIHIAAYGGILNTLGAGGYVDESLGLDTIDYGTDHFTCFQFDYDWRQDLSFNAHRLKIFIDERRRYIQNEYDRLYGIKDAEVKFDIVGHSMGGLLTRYFLRYGGHELPEDGSVPPVTWEGANDVARAILVAPPNAGSLDAFEQLIKGFSAGGPFIPTYEAAVLGTFPSLYQLMPRPRHGRIIKDNDINQPVGDLYDQTLWEKNGWGLTGRDKVTRETLEVMLPGVDDEEVRYQLARDYQGLALDRARQFHQALDQPSQRPDNLDVFLVAGDGLATAEYYSLSTETKVMTAFGEIPGDSVVSRNSALLDERVNSEWHPTLKSPIKWDGVMFLASGHRQITSNGTFEDNVLYWLLEDPRLP